MSYLERSVQKLVRRMLFCIVSASASFPVFLGLSKLKTLFVLQVMTVMLRFFLYLGVSIMGGISTGAFGLSHLKIMF